jgi:peptidyl-prolyl cis-trans isomerase B (cyclophilin B)
MGNLRYYASGSMRYLPMLVVLALAACGGGNSGTRATATAPTGADGCPTVVQPAPAQRTRKAPTTLLDATKTYDVMIRTNCGSFTIRLDPERSPHAVASFVALTRTGYFDHTIFDRIVPGALIQSGDPTATGAGGPGYTTVDKPPSSATYEHGVVAMAKTKSQPPGTAGSQFFIVTASDAGLPPDYAIVGEVVKGLDVIDRIGMLGGGSDLPSQVQHVSGSPSQIVEINQATVVTS